MATGKPDRRTADGAVEKDRISIRNPTRGNPAHEVSDTLCLESPHIGEGMPVAYAQSCDISFGIFAFRAYQPVSLHRPP